VAIGGYYINGYWWLLMPILLMAICGYSIVSHWWLLMVIFINGY
jgi:hypothetical protein